MIDTRTAPYAVTALRVALGILFLAHAGLKLFVVTLAGTALALPPILLGAIFTVHRPAGFFFTNPNGG